jgi:hypothetical protein
MMKIIEKEFNAITGEETITEREETAAETKARLNRAKEIAEAQAQAEAEAQAKRAAAEAKLAALGLTTDDLKALGIN